MLKLFSRTAYLGRLSMIMFDANKGVSFVKTVAGGFLAWFGVVQACEFLWSKWGINSPDLIWAYTFATFFLIIYISMFVCFSRQVVYQQRLKECAEAKRNLEEQILKRRQSSKKRFRTGLN